MMKRVILICMVGLLALSATTAVSARVEREPFTSVGTLVDIPDMGRWFLADGTQHYRAMVESIRTVSEDPRITGWHTVVANGNWDADGYGPVWGTYHLDVDAYNGYWEGTMAGKSDENGMALRMQGRGYGALTGLRIEGTYLDGVTTGVIITLPQP